MVSGEKEPDVISPLGGLWVDNQDCNCTVYRISRAQSICCFRSGSRLLYRYSYRRIERYHISQMFGLSLLFLVSMSSLLR